MRIWTPGIVTAAVLALGLGSVALDSIAAEGRAAASAPSSANAANPANEPALDGAKLYREKTCIACHGPDAKTPILPEYPRLAGQNEAYIARQIRDIKSGARSNGNTAAMRGVLFLVNDREIDALAHYLSGLQP
ncbi:MAG: c-type cytochrome [Myxococcota bacterium]